MKSYKIIFTLFGLCILTSAHLPVQDTYSLAKGYTVTINGTSNLHNWNETVVIVSGESVINWNSDGSFNLEGATIKMNVHSIKSDMSAMDNNTYKALKADTYPEITFVLTTPVKSVQAKSGAKAIDVKGNLTITGVTKPVNMQVKTFMQGDGKLAFEGVQTVKMTDYGVKPPVALFGTLKTGDAITISFNTSFTKSN